jgi:tetratricopeptide (TPR) repeat protein
MGQPGQSGLLIASEVLERLAADPSSQTVCFRALKHAQDGQINLSQGDAQRALPDLLKAHELFAQLPAARSLLGIAKADLAAAYGNLGRYRESLPYAQDAIAITANVPRLEFTEAMARMTLANTYSILGKAVEGRSEYRKAREILERIPGSESYLKMLERNEATVAKAERKRQIRNSSPSSLPRAILVLSLLVTIVLLAVLWIRS